MVASEREPWVERSFDAPNIAFRCGCGWRGTDAEVEEWAIDRDRHRAVRRCPDCGEPVPEWGAIRPLAGAARVARGGLARALADAGVPTPDEGDSHGSSEP